MDEGEFDKLLRRVLRQDYSAGTEGFRDSLLERCLSQLNADDGGACLDDADLGFLAAAGDAASEMAPHTFPSAMEGCL